MNSSSCRPPRLCYIRGIVPPFALIQPLSTAKIIKQRRNSYQIHWWYDIQGLLNVYRFCQRTIWGLGINGRIVKFPETEEFGVGKRGWDDGPVCQLFVAFRVVSTRGLGKASTRWYYACQPHYLLCKVCALRGRPGRGSWARKASWYIFPHIPNISFTVSQFLDSNSLGNLDQIL